MKKLHLLIPLALIVVCGCKDKNKPTPEPEEYFSFYADGVFYDYPQEKESSWLGERKTLIAGPSSSIVVYIISARTLNPIADGSVYFMFAGDHIPTQDTIILNGSSSGVGISKFGSMENNYEVKTPLTGKIVFTERSSSKLTGTFSFDAYKMKVEGMYQVPTDTIIHITNGKFSIIPSN